MHFEIDRRDIRQFRLAPSVVPSTLDDSQVVLQLERAALTSNNVSYALSGDMLDYWGFFPTENGWGRLPVMGFGVVTESANTEIAVGTRYFGFFPLADHHVVNSQRSSNGFIDAAPWRQKHAMTYRRFELASPQPNDDAALVLRGLFTTSFLLDDFLREHEFFGAQRVIITSASSKTAIALAHCLKRGGNTSVVGLTSAKHVAFVAQLGEYDEVVDYESLASLQPDVATVIVDMSGNQGVVAALHEQLSGHVNHSCSVGATHWDAPRSGTNIPEPQPKFFFAPSQVAKRNTDWGREVLNTRLAEGLALFVEASTAWMTIQHISGAAEVSELYRNLIAGQVAPSHGNIVSLH